MMKVSRGNKGFTLIELLIVVAIIGILAAIAIPSYNNYATKSKISGVVNSMGAVKTALLAYFTEWGAGPGDLADAAAIQNRIGVLPATQYATYTYTSATRVLQATMAGNVDCGVGVNAGTITMTPDAGFTTVAWAGTCNAQYIPR